MNRACCTGEAAVQLLLVPIKSEILAMVTADLRSTQDVTGGSCSVGLSGVLGGSRALQGQSATKLLRAAIVEVGSMAAVPRRPAVQAQGFLSREFESPGRKAQGQGNLYLGELNRVEKESYG